MVKTDGDSSEKLEVPTMRMPEGFEEMGVLDIFRRAFDISQWEDEIVGCHGSWARSCLHSTSKKLSRICTDPTI